MSAEMPLWVDDPDDPGPSEETNGEIHRPDFETLIASAEQEVQDRQTRELTAIAEFEPLDVYEAETSIPEFHVQNLVPVNGFSILWSPAAGLKSYFQLALVLQMLEPTGKPREAFGIPNMEIKGRWTKVLWLACEEAIGRLHYRAERLHQGMDIEKPPKNSLLYMPAELEDETRIKLDHLPTIAEIHRPDCIVIDYMTGFRDFSGQTKHDLDNDAAHLATRPLRKLAAQGTNIAVIHHANAAGERLRGASEYSNACDTEIRIESAKKGHGTHAISVVKMKDGPKTAKPIPIDAEFTDQGVSITYAGPPPDDSDDLSPALDKVLAVVRTVTPLDASQQTTGSIAESCDISRQAASKHLNDLKRRKLVESSQKNKEKVWFAIG